jgi:hypothetical protein
MTGPTGGIEPREVETGRVPAAYKVESIEGRNKFSESARLTVI